VIVHHSGEAMSLTRYGGIGTRELKARLGDPEKLPTLGQVQTELFTKTTSVTARRNGEMVRRHREELRPLSTEHRRMKEAHRGQRQTLAGNQTRRAGQEAQARAARLRKGIMGLWDRLSGKRGKISELNAREMTAGRVRDRAEQENLKTGQRQERGELQGRVMQMREQHRRDRQDHRAELGAMLAMMQESVRDRFMEHGQELEAKRRNPPTAAQVRRDRAEKTDTMPVIVVSERTRRADARRDREAGKTPVEGQEAGTGESAPENKQATHAQPEAAQQQDSAQEQEPKQWTREERQARIDAERERQEQARRDRGSNDNDPGRTMEP
jgi:hypothetical protein